LLTLRTFSLEHWCFEAIREFELDSRQEAKVWIRLILDFTDLELLFFRHPLHFLELALIRVDVGPFHGWRRRREEVDLLFFSLTFPCEFKKVLQIVIFMAIFVNCKHFWSFIFGLFVFPMYLRASA